MRMQRFSTDDPWDLKFLQVAEDYWSRRMQSIDGCRFVDEFCGELRDLAGRGKHEQFALTLESVGGEFEFGDAARNERPDKSLEQLVCEMVARRFDHLGPFQVVDTIDGSAFIVQTTS